MAMIEEKHSAIANTFQTGAWRRLQRSDSDIALEVITNLMAKGIVALPVHDSFIVTEDKKGALQREMLKVYINMYGYNPVVK